MAEALLRFLGREHAAAGREQGAVDQWDMEGWGVAAGSVAEGSTEPMPPLPSALYPYQTLPPATATEAGALPVPVG
ncbi:hypothetical protein GCM10023100_37040 [Actinocorallia cavernae]|uniref:Uncharacterized protein n=2 Tax=Actinomycetes TaxID=1760 RepID=A0ABN3MEM1_9ACTN